MRSYNIAALASNNNNCTARALVTADLMPLPPTRDADTITLTDVPEGIMVQPDMLNTTTAQICTGLPPGTVCLTPAVTNFFQVRFPDAEHYHGQDVKSLKYRIRGYDKLVPRIAFTDFYAKGATSPSEVPHVVADIHQLPPTGTISLAFPYVAITRYRRFKDIHMLTPMWSTPQNRNAAIQEMRKPWTLPTDVRAADEVFAIRQRTLTRLAARRGIRQHAD